MVIRQEQEKEKQRNEIYVFQQILFVLHLYSVEERLMFQASFLIDEI